LNKAIIEHVHIRQYASLFFFEKPTHPYFEKKGPHSLPFASHIIPHLVFCLRVFVACLHEWDQASFSAAAVELRFEPIPSAFESSCVRLKCRSMGDRSVAILVSRNESYI